MRKMLRNFWAMVALCLASACAGEDIGEAFYSADQCRRLAVVDGSTGELIVGAEDFDIDRLRGRLFFSAYDRRAVERAARRGAMAIPGGGVYAVTLADIFNQDGSEIKAAPLAAQADIAGGLRPHGITYDSNNEELVFVNRTYQRMNGRWKMTPRLQRIGANGELFIGATSDAPCAANDVLTTEQHIFTTFDHSACDWRAGIEDVFNLKRSGVAMAASDRGYFSAAFANGLARSAAGEIVMADTREKALLLFKERADGVEEAARFDLPGGPDNLSIALNGDVIAAAHPSLWRLAMNRKFGIGKAPSRIVKVNQKNGDIDILYDDTKGKLFSAATVAVETRDGLVAGSVTDAGFLVCQAAQ